MDSHLSRRRSLAARLLPSPSPKCNMASHIALRVIAIRRLQLDDSANPLGRVSADGKQDPVTILIKVFKNLTHFWLRQNFTLSAAVEFWHKKVDNFGAIAPKYQGC